MAVLHNRVNRRILKQKLHAEGGERMTLSFYGYHLIEHPDKFRDSLYKAWKSMGVLGRTYVAHEGINAQVSLPRQAFDDFRRSLDDTGFLKGVRLNVAVEDDGKSFFVLKIAVKKKIVADGISDNRFDASHSGTHLDAAAFNKLSNEPGTIVVDMRNHYESEVGRFRDAICPDVDTFRESLPVVENLLQEKKDKNIIMYCTGGIRCEKASAWMLHRGFKNVFQLDGGIIEYARQVKAQGLENKFIGKNFVFDERMSERISPEIISVCHQCGTPCDTHTNCRNDGCHLLFIQCEACAAKYSGCCSEACQEIVALPAEAQRELRKGKAQLRKVFKKGRFDTCETSPKSMTRIGIINVSDRASRGEYEDLPGKAIEATLREYLKSPWEKAYAVIPDEQGLIEQTLITMADKEGCCLIITSGGTGPAVRDVTPEATFAVCDKMLPGFGELMRLESLKYVPTAILSRQTAGIRGKSLIVNLPGKPKSIRQCLDAIFPAIPYCLDLLGGPYLECNEGVMKAFRPPTQ